MQIGVILEKGPADWQIFQRQNGAVRVELGGRWVLPEGVTAGRVMARVVREETGETVVPWTPSVTEEDGKWSGVLTIPCGGLYRLETCLDHDGTNGAVEWAVRGDMVHHLGVGDLYAIAGQSNSAGYGKDPIYDPPEMGVHLLKNSGRWDLASHPLNESTATAHDENREAANPGHSPYLHFAKVLKRELGYPIGLIQAALGGSPLSAWNPDEDGILYRGMMERIRSQGGRIRGMLWYQGCSDAGEGLCDTYPDRFANMVRHLRKDVEDEGLPVLTVQLNRYVAPGSPLQDTCWGKVREAQRQAAKVIPDVYVVPAVDGGLSDAIHISSASNMVLGERLARTALGVVYGRMVHYNAPDLASVRQTAANQVLLTFENVSGRLYAFDVGPEALPFTVSDREGLNGVTAYEFKGKGIFLTLAREIQGDAVVHGAWEMNPKPVIPIDSEGHLPMLAFYGAAVMRN